MQDDIDSVDDAWVDLDLLAEPDLAAGATGCDDDGDLADLADLADEDLADIETLTERLTPEWTWADDEMEFALANNLIGYEHWPKDAFVISGPLAPHRKSGPGVEPEVGVRCATDRQFDSVGEALKWAEQKYGKVYANRSRAELGVWAALVKPIAAKVEKGAAKPIERREERV